MTQPPDYQKVDTLDKVKVGDQVAWFCEKLGLITYYHHAIVVEKHSNEMKLTVVQRTSSYSKIGKSIGGNEGYIERKAEPIDLEEQEFFVINHAYKPYSLEEVVKRAKSRIGEKGYNLLTQNCEHFANWCKIGQERSYQVEEHGEELLALF